MLPPTGKKCRGSMPDFCQTMSSLEPVLKAYEGPDKLFLYNFNAVDHAVGAISICDRGILVEPDGVEPTTSCLQSRRSTN